MNWSNDIKPKQLKAYRALYSFGIDDIHSSWIKEIPHCERLSRKNNAVIRDQYLSDYIFEHLNLKQGDTIELEQAIPPLLLMSADSLEQIFTLFGAIQFQQEIAHTIIKSDLVSLKRSIGIHIYEFTLSHARLISLPPLSNKEALLKLYDTNPGNALKIAGAKTLNQAFNIKNKPLRQRIRYKLPKQYFNHFLKSPCDITNRTIMATAEKLAKDFSIPCSHLLA